jgi:hypothetical protein
MTGLTTGRMAGLITHVEARGEEAMVKGRGVGLTTGVLTGLFHLHKYRMLSIPQFARVSRLSYKHAAEVLLGLEQRGVLGYLGYTSIPGQGKTRVRPRCRSDCGAAHRRDGPGSRRNWRGSRRNWRLNRRDHRLDGYNRVRHRDWYIDGAQRCHEWFWQLGDNGHGHGQRRWHGWLRQWCGNHGRYRRCDGQRPVIQASAFWKG